MEADRSEAHLAHAGREQELQKKGFCPAALPTHEKYRCLCQCFFTRSGISKMLLPRVSCLDMDDERWSGDSARALQE
jgi:hypothetical protein